MKIPLKFSLVLGPMAYRTPREKSDLKNILFLQNTTDGKPLFKDGKTLGQLIHLKNKKDYPSLPAVLSYLAQIFNNKRNCSEKFRNSIIVAVEDRLKKQGKTVTKQWVEKVNSALDLQRAFKSNQFSPDKLFKEIIDMAKVAKTHLVITPTTAEELTSENATVIKKILIDRLRLWRPKTSVDYEMEPDTSYKFWLPSERSAERFWKRLFDSITNVEKFRTIFPNEEYLPLEKSEADKLLTSRNEEFLEVWAVPEFVCGCPMVVFDADSNDSVSYTFFYHDNDKISAAKMDTTTLGLWKTNVLFSYDSMNRKEIKWSEVNRATLLGGQ